MQSDRLQGAFLLLLLVVGRTAGENVNVLLEIHPELLLGSSAVPVRLLVSVSAGTHDDLGSLG